MLLEWEVEMSFFLLALIKDEYFLHIILMNDKYLLYIINENENMIGS